MTRVAISILSTTIGEAAWALLVNNGQDSVEKSRVVLPYTVSNYVEKPNGWTLVRCERASSMQPALKSASPEAHGGHRAVKVDGYLARVRNFAYETCTWGLIEPPYNPQATGTNQDEARGVDQPRLAISSKGKIISLDWIETRIPLTSQPGRDAGAAGHGYHSMYLCTGLDWTVRQRGSA